MKSRSSFFPTPVILFLLTLAGCGVTSEPEPATVLVAGGSFTMGTTEPVEELRSRYGVGFPGSFENEFPPHRVTLSDFRIDPTEVTNRRFAVFVEANPEWAPQQVPAHLHNGRYLEHWEGGSYPDELENHPVVFVTWHAAQAFCRWSGGRLPTEAEWEYSARARGDIEFPWGNELPAPDRANYNASEIGTTTPVASYPANAIRLHDQAGNVWEWLLDEWASTYSAEPQVDPIAGGEVDAENLAAVTGRRAVRGASFGGAVINLRTRWRDSHVVTNATEFVGFRCVYPQ